MLPAGQRALHAGKSPWLHPGLAQQCKQGPCKQEMHTAPVGSQSPHCEGWGGVLVGRWSLKPEGPVQFAWLLLKHKSSIIFSASFAEAVRALSIPELPVDSTNQSLVLSHVHLDLDSVSS